MLLELAQMTAVTVSSDDRYTVPRTEQVIYRAACPQGEFEVIERAGTLTLVVAGRKADLTGTRFYQSYRAGSHVGQFAASCSRGAEFTYSYFGVEMAPGGPVGTVLGTLVLNFDRAIVRDGAIAREDVNLSNFNRERRERMQIK